MFYQPPFVEAYNNMVDSAPFSPQIQRFGVPFDNPYQGHPQPVPGRVRADAASQTRCQFEMTAFSAYRTRTDWKPARTS